MNIPSVPTDNLYKFIAVFGLIISLFSYYYVIKNIVEVSNNIRNIENELEYVQSMQELYSTLLKKEGTNKPIIIEEVKKSGTQLDDLRTLNSQNLVHNNFWINLVLILIGSFGAYLVKYGFYNWYEKHQKYIDAEAKWRGEIYLELLENQEEKNRIVKEIIDKNTQPN